MNVRKRVGIRLFSVIAAVAVAAATIPAQLFVAADSENLLAGLEWTTDIPDTQFIYGNGPGVQPAIKGWLTDGVYDAGDYVNGGAHVVGFNQPGYLEFDMGSNKTFRQIKITSATTQSFQEAISVFAKMKMEVYRNGSWDVICDATDVPYASNHTYVFSCADGDSITASKIRFYFEPKQGLRFNVFSEFEVLEEAAAGDVDGQLVPPSDPVNIVNLSQGKSYTIRREENTDYPDTNGTELTDGVLGTADYEDPAWSGCSYGGTTTGKVYDRWPLRSVIIDLGGTKSVTQISANFLTDSSKDIYQPQSIRTYASMDGENWMPLSRLNQISTYAPVIQTYGWHVNGSNGIAVDLTGDENSIVLANYIRFDVEKFSWNFMDEVTVMGYDGIHSQALPITNTTKLEDGEIQRADASTGNIRDMVLCYNGYYSSGAGNWTAEKFKPYLTYVDGSGNSLDTMYDAVMFLGLDSPNTSGQAYATENDQITADDWTWYLEKTFEGDNSDIAALNEAARIASEDLNMPDYKIKLTVMLPYPPDKATSFGNLGGRDLNLSVEADWQYAIDWYIDQVLNYIDNGNYQYIDFMGFYWVNEYPSGIPRIQYASEKIHDTGYKFYWIPYYSSVGFFWNDDLGFDAITLQPNHFFANPNENTVGAGGTKQIGNTAQIAAYAGIGVEMEFDSNLTSNVEKYNQGLDYLNGAVEYGFDGPDYYRNWYEGGGALYACAYSELPVVREYYDNIYQLMKGTYEPREYVTTLANADPDNVLFGVPYTTSLTIGDPNASGGPQGNYVGDDDGVKLTDGLTSYQTYHKSVGNLEFADLTFDLGASKAMQEINLDMVSGFYGIWRPSQVQIQISNDTGEEKTWQTVYEGEVPAEDNSSRTLTYRTENGDQIVARYLRFNVYFNSKSPWIACKEIRAYDKVSDAAADGTLTVPSDQPDPAEVPAFTKDLANTAEVVSGGTLTLSVEANVSDGGTLSYQWYKGGTAIGDNSDTLTISDVAQGDAGTYKVVVTNTKDGAMASVISTSCKVTVTENKNILKGVKYTTTLRDGDANAGTGDFQGDHMDVDRSKLTDGVSGATQWEDAITVGYYARNPVQPVDITFHLSDTPQAFQQINIGAISGSNVGILLPSNIKIEIKNGAADDWRTIYDEGVTDTSQNKRFVFTTEEGTSFEATDVRFMFSPASSWVFLDEIEMRMAADGSETDGILKEVAPPSGTNIALNRPYTTTFASSAGKFYPNNVDTNYELSNGVKVSDSNYLNKEWTGYLYPEAVTIAYDLGEIATITAVKTHVYTANKDGITTAQSYTVQVSSDGVRWTTVYDDNTSAIGQEWLTYRAPDKGIRGRYVRVTMKTGNMLFLDEVEVWGEGGKELEPEPDPDTVANHAKGKGYYIYASDPNNASATFPAADEAAWPDATGAVLTDGVVDTSGNWQANKAQWISWQKDSGSMDVTAIFDLQTEKAIHEISATFVQDDANGVKLPGNMEVWVSNQVNGENIQWLKMYDKAVSASSGKTVKLTYTVSEIFRARYVKLVFKQTSDYMGIGEVEINGKGNTTGAIDPIDIISRDFVNLSQGKTYVVSDKNSQYPDTNYELTNGKFATGGTSDGAWSGFSFTPGGAKFVTLDLGDTYMVSKFSANFLISSNTNLPKTVQYMVSQDGANWTTVYNGKNLSASNGTYKLQSLVGTPVKARYVMFYFYGESGVSIVDEVEVFGNATPVKPDVTPPGPNPGTDAKNYLIPGSATGGIRNLAILDTASFQNAGSVLEQGFDGVAIKGDASRYGQILSDLNQKATDTVKVVLEATVPFMDNVNSLDNVVSAFNAGSYDKLQLIGILAKTDLASADTLTAKIHEKSLKAFWIGDYYASGIANWSDHGIDAAICQAGSASNLTSAAEVAKENGLGMALDLSQGYDKALDFFDETVQNGFQGKYVFRAYILGTQTGTDEQNARMVNSLAKLMKGTLKVSNRNTPAAPTAENTYSTWVSLNATNGYEYSKDGSSWTIDPVFTGLTPETQYTFYQRVKANHSAEASLMSTALTVTTPETPTEAEPMVPTFTTNLATSKSAQAGDKVTLTVAASVSDGGTLSYQWYKGDQAISGATSASYTFNSIQKSDEGSYKVVVTNTLNDKTATATSNVCVITVEVPAEPMAPSFISNLSSSKAAQTGDQVTFAVKAVSNNNGTLSYQWYKNGQAIAGATSDSYTIASASLSDGGVYYVDVTDKSNNTHALSNSCTLTVTEKDIPSGGGSTGGWGSGGTPVQPDVVVGVWKKLPDGTMVYVEDNKPVTGWKTINSVSYYFNSEGVMQTGWFKDGGYWYYLKDNGAMATGWNKVDNKWYFLRDNGTMATGWNKVGNTWFYLQSSGVMKTGWLKDGNTWYYLHDWGGMANTEWVNVNGSWYYFGGNGTMMTGWLQQGNTWYYLKANGQMATGWNWVGNKCYYFNESGKMAANTTVNGYKVDASGAWVK